MIENSKSIWKFLKLLDDNLYVVFYVLKIYLGHIS
jgi:hypothetical protein